MPNAYLFPGQGSQYVGMGKELYERSSAARLLYEEADALLGFKISDLAFYGPEEKLKDTEFQQPALFVASMANWQAVTDGDWPEADFFAGHSLGEFAAFVAAGSLSFGEGLGLVRRRGQLMKEAGELSPGAMAALLALSIDQVESLCAQAEVETGSLVRVANDNCPGQTVISGDKVALQRAVELAEQSGARRVVQLPISIAAHTDLMSSVAAEFASAVDQVTLQEPIIPVVGNVSALPVRNEDEIRSELKAQLTAPVAWSRSISYLVEQGADTFIEVGPNDVLLGLVKRIDRRTKRIAFDTGPK